MHPNTYYGATSKNAPSQNCAPPTYSGANYPYCLPNYAAQSKLLPTLNNRPDIHSFYLIQQNNSKKKERHNEDPRKILGGVTKKNGNGQSAPRTRTSRKTDQANENLTNKNVRRGVYQRVSDQMGQHFSDCKIPPQPQAQLQSGIERSVNQPNTSTTHLDFHPTHFENTPYNHENPPTHRPPRADAIMQRNYDSIAQKLLCAANNSSINNVTTMQNKEILPTENFTYNYGFDNNLKEHFPLSQSGDANNEPSIAPFATMLGRYDSQCFKNSMSTKYNPKFNSIQFNNPLAMKPPVNTIHYNNTNQLESSSQTTPPDNTNQDNYNIQAVDRPLIWPPILNPLQKNNSDIGMSNYSNQIENPVNKASNLQTQSTDEIQHFASNFEIRDQIQSKKVSVLQPVAMNRNCDGVQQNAQPQHLSSPVNTNNCTDFQKSGNVNEPKKCAIYNVDILNPHYIQHSPDSTNFESTEQTQPLDFAIRKPVAVITNDNVIPKSIPTQPKSNVIDTGENGSNNFNVQNDHVTIHRNLDIKQINCSNKTESLHRSELEYLPDSTNYQMSPDIITNDATNSNINHDPRKKMLRRNSVYAPRLQEPICLNNVTAPQSVSLPPNKPNEKGMLNNVELERGISSVIKNAPAINNSVNNIQTLNISTNVEANHPSIGNIKNCPVPSVVATHQNISKPGDEYSHMNTEQESHPVNINKKITQIMQKCSADEIEVLKQFLNNKPIAIEPVSQRNNIAISVETKGNINEDMKDSLTSISESNNLNKSISVDLCDNVILLEDESDTSEFKSNHLLTPDENVKEKKVFDKLTDHNDKSNVCGKCGEAFIDRSSLLDHVKTHKSNNFNESEPVHISFDTGELEKRLVKDDSVLNQPLVSKKIEAVKVVFDKLINNNDVSIQCIKCKHVFTNSYMLMEHLKNHESKNLNKCKSVNVDRVCSDQTKENSTVNDLHKNQLTKRNARIKKDFHKQNRCLKCGDCFNSMSLLINHVKTHSYDNEISSNRKKFRAATEIIDLNEDSNQNGDEEHLLHTEAKCDDVIYIDNLSMKIPLNNNETTYQNTFKAVKEIENENKDKNQNGNEEQLSRIEYSATVAECDDVIAKDNLSMKISLNDNETSYQNTLTAGTENENEDTNQNGNEEQLSRIEYSATIAEYDDVTGKDDLSMKIPLNDNETSYQNTLIAGTEIENENEDTNQNGNEEYLSHIEYSATEAECDDVTGKDNLSMTIPLNDNVIIYHDTLVTGTEIENENEDTNQNGNEEHLSHVEYSATEAECDDVIAKDNSSMKIPLNDNEISYQNTLIAGTEIENEDTNQNGNEEYLFHIEYSATDVECHNITGIDNLNMPIIDDDYETHLEMDGSNNNEEILLEMEVSDINVENDEEDLMEVLLFKDCDVKITSLEKALCDANLKHCEYCELKFASDRDIQKHYNNSHPDILINNEYLCKGITRKRGLHKEHKSSEGSSEKKRAIQRVYSPGKMARTPIISDNERDSNSTCIFIYSNSMKTNSDSDKEEKIKNKSATMTACNIDEKNDKCEIKAKKKRRKEKKNKDFNKEVNKRVNYDDDTVYDKISSDTEKKKKEYEKKRKWLKKKLSNKNSDSTDVSISHDLKKKSKDYAKEKKMKNKNGITSIVPVSPSSNRKETQNSIFVPISSDFKNNKKAKLGGKRDNSSAVSVSIEKKSREQNKKDNATKNLAVSDLLNIKKKNIEPKKELSAIKKCEPIFSATERVRKKKMLKEYYYSTYASTSRKHHIKRNTYDGNVNMKKTPHSLIPVSIPVSIPISIPVSCEYAGEENKSELRKSDVLKYKIKKIGSKPSNPQKIKCIICNIIFESKYKLSEHMENAHGNIMADYDGSMFSCKECKEEFQNNYFLNKHKKDDCPILLNTKSSKNNLDLMTSIHIENDAFQCDICKQKFKSKAILCEHLQKVHVNERKISLSAHDYNIEFLKYHFMMVAPPALKPTLNYGKNDDVMDLKTMPSNRFQCDICGKIFLNKVTLYEHKQRAHVNETEYALEMLADEKVQDCQEMHSDDKSSDHDLIKSTSVSDTEIIHNKRNAITESKTMLGEHIEKAHVGDKSGLSDLDVMTLIINSDSDTYCDICKKIFETITELDEHNQKEHPNKKMRTSHMMSDLELINVLDSQLKCDICNETFQTKDKLYEHTQEAHTKENVPANNESVSNSDLIKLMVGSTISYQCNLCFENFNNSHNFMNHYVLHSKTKKKTSKKSF